MRISGPVVPIDKIQKLFQFVNLATVSTMLTHEDVATTEQMDFALDNKTKVNESKPLLNSTSFCSPCHVFCFVFLTFFSFGNSRCHIMLYKCYKIHVTYKYFIKVQYQLPYVV